MNDAGKLREVLEEFQSKCIDLATGRETAYEEWESARGSVLQIPSLLRRVPDWMASQRFGSQFWQFIKGKFPTYAERRQFIWDSFAPLFAFAERGATQPVGMSLDPLLEGCSSATVSEAWERVHSRRQEDPEGAITAARSMLESVCKFILDELGETYTEKEDLPQLYRMVAKRMTLSPSQHHEQVFKQILSGCGSVVVGLAGLRNKLGDAHGKGRQAPKPTGRHADLAANLAGSITAFLIATYEERYR